MLKLPAKNIKEIAVLRALQLGDILCSIPAIRSLRKAYPDARITFLGLQTTEHIISRFSNYIDNFIAFPGHPGLPEQEFDPDNYDKFLKKIIDIDFDLVIQLQGNGSIVNELMRDFRASHNAGFCEQIEHENDTFLYYPNFGHEITRHLALMEHLGIPSTGTTLEFPIYPKDHEDLNAIGLSFKPQSYICVHPGSRGYWRQWPPSHFSSMADYCANKGYDIVLTGTKDELELVKKVASSMKTPPIITAGKTSLGMIAVLIKNAFAIISNCTGVSHLASAFNTSGIIISMDNEPDRWGPLNKELLSTFDWIKYPYYNQALKELKRTVFRH